MALVVGITKSSSNRGLWCGLAAALFLSVSKRHRTESRKIHGQLK